ncbi:MAG: hypothetical protein NZ518_03070, partial [Dehalococcoidia bacterium]|nr:hypothetical protein [Dehalococcoidia bacterium]
MVENPVTGEFQLFDDPPALQARTQPPRWSPRWLTRARVDSLLATAMEYPVTEILAPPGGGKTVALTGFAHRGGWPLAWLRLEAEDTPTTIIALLIGALGTVVGGLSAPREPTGVAALDRALDVVAASLDDDTLLVLDQYDRVADRPDVAAVIDRLVANLPNQLHLAIASRVIPSSPVLGSMWARGELRRLTATDLAFTVEEAEAWCAQLGRPRCDGLAAAVEDARGWAIATRRYAAAAPVDAQVRRDVERDLAEFFRWEALEPLTPPQRAYLPYSAAAWRIPADDADLPAPPEVRAVGAATRARALFTEPAPDGSLAWWPLVRRLIA